MDITLTPSLLLTTGNSLGPLSGTIATEEAHVPATPSSSLVTTEPFIPASFSNRRGRGARRRRLQPLQSLEQSTLEQVFITPDFDRFFTIAADSGENLAAVDVR